MVYFTAFGGVIVLYWVCLAIYRLYLSPLAKVPGPKIAGKSHVMSGTQSVMEV